MVRALIVAAGKWNTFVISARGPRLTVVMNGTKTAEYEQVLNKLKEVLATHPGPTEVHLRLQELLYSYDDGSDDGEWPPNEPQRR